MIYQLKISLKDAKPPIWRRILIEADTNFHVLHHTIQLAFDWENAHLYYFSSPFFQEANGQPIFIEPSVEEAHQFDPMNHRYIKDEEIFLADAFEKVKDKVTYVYDLGDNWEHTIELEKILEKDADKVYPICTAARQFPPEEDSRMGATIEPLNHNFKPKEIVEYINQQLKFVQDFDTPINVTNNVPIDEWNSLFDLADVFFKLKPWQEIEDQQFIAVWNEEIDDYVYCSIMGKAGIMEGLAIYPGKDGLRSLFETYFSDEDDELGMHLMMSQRTITLSFDDKIMLDETELALVEELGRKSRRKKGWPSFLTQEPCYLPWQLSQKEVTILKQTLPQIFDISKRVKLGSLDVDLKTGEWFARDLDTNGNWIDASIDPTVKIDEAMMIPEVPLLISEVELMRLKKQYRKLNQPIELDFVLFPEPVQDSPNERGFFPELMLAVEKKSSLTLHYEMFPPSRDPKKYQEDFVSMLVKNEFIPREIWMMNERFISYLKPVLNFLSIKVIEVQRLDKVDRVLEEMQDEIRF